MLVTPPAPPGMSVELAPGRALATGLMTVETGRDVVEPGRTLALGMTTGDTGRDVVEPGRTLAFGTFPTIGAERGVGVGMTTILIPPFFPPSLGRDVEMGTFGEPSVGGKTGISTKGGRIGCRPAPPPLAPLFPEGQERE